MRGRNPPERVEGTGCAHLPRLPVLSPADWVRAHFHARYCGWRSSRQRSLLRLEAAVKPTKALTLGREASSLPQGFRFIRKISEKYRFF